MTRLILLVMLVASCRHTNSFLVTLPDGTEAWTVKCKGKTECYRLMTKRCKNLKKNRYEVIESDKYGSGIEGTTESGWDTHHNWETNQVNEIVFICK